MLFYLTAENTEILKLNRLKFLTTEAAEFTELDAEFKICEILIICV